MKLYRIQQNLLILILLLIPFVSIGEVSTLIHGELLPETVGSGSIVFMKWLKDIILICIILIGIFINLGLNFRRKYILVFLILSLSVAPSIIMSVNSSFIAIASGIRWLLPVFLVFFISSAVSYKFITFLTKILIGIFFVHFSFQWIEFFFAEPWYGINRFGFSNRNPGVFLIPNTGAFFTLNCLYFIVFLSKFSFSLKIFFIFLSFISVILTLSGTGLILLLILTFFFFFKKRYSKYFIYLFILFFIFLFLGISAFESRGSDYINISGGERLNIVHDIFVNASMFSDKFGQGTNTAFILGVGYILDSLYASLIFNLGWFGFIGILLPFILFLLKSCLLKDISLFVFLLFYSLYSFTTISFEVYPVNIIFAILISFFWKNVNKKKYY